MKRVLLSLSFLVWLGSSRLFAIGLETALGLLQFSPSGNIAYKGISLNLENDLNYGKTNSIYGLVKIDLPLLLPNFYLTATPMRFSGQGKKDITFQYGDLNFTASVPFESTLRLDHYDGVFFYGVPALKTATAGKVDMELGLNIRIIDFKTEIKQSLSSLEESKSLTIPLPMGYFAFQLQPMDFLKFQGELRGIAYDSNHYYDLVGKVKIKAFKFIFLSGGYKYQNIKADQSGVKADLEFKGPLAEVGIEF